MINLAAIYVVFLVEHENFSIKTSDILACSGHNTSCSKKLSQQELSCFTSEVLIIVNGLVNFTYIFFLLFSYLMY